MNKLKKRPTFFCSDSGLARSHAGGKRHSNYQSNVPHRIPRNFWSSDGVEYQSEHPVVSDRHLSSHDLTASSRDTSYSWKSQGYQYRNVGYSPDFRARTGSYSDQDQYGSSDQRHRMSGYKSGDGRIGYSSKGRGQYRAEGNLTPIKPSQERDFQKSGTPTYRYDRKRSDSETSQGNLGSTDQPRSSALKDSDQFFKAARMASEQADGKILSSVKSEADQRLYQRLESLKEKNGLGYEGRFERDSPQKKHESPRRSSVSSDVSDDRERTKTRGSFEKKDLFAAASHNYVREGIAAQISGDKVSVDPVRVSVTRSETLTADQRMLEKNSPIPLWMKSHLLMPCTAAVSSSINSGHAELAFSNVMASVVSEKPTESLAVSSQGTGPTLKQGQMTQGTASAESGIVFSDVERTRINEGADVGGRLIYKKSSCMRVAQCFFSILI